MISENNKNIVDENEIEFEIYTGRKIDQPG
jgi:hypothetical protein